MTFAPLTSLAVAAAAPPMEHTFFGWIPVFLIATILTIIFTIAVFDPDPGPGDRVMMWHGWVALALIVPVGGLVWACVQDVAAIDAHHVTVQEWLADEHGVDVTEAETAALLEGGVHGVDIDGEFVRIELTARADGTIAVSNADGGPLTGK